MKSAKLSIFVAAIWAVFLCLPASAQWQTPNHSVPVGKGAGVTGFGSMGPCNPNKIPAWSSTTSDPACTNLQGLNGNYRVVTTAGDVTINSAVTDYMIVVNKTAPAATNVNFPSIASRIAAGGAPIFLKNSQSNPALYPLTPVLSGTDTMEGTATPLQQDSRAGVWYWPDATVTPNNWEIR
ncbi:MAG: hypothetical protein KGL39_30865 [Patescibacteria group bacterium]|nr:hypothetical protein [Patescibacteria group bacterium]